ncbi:hypothetical protein HAX54_013215 [Datura stramonium]|uniref:Uncharacterized protein n=1 Tax=Datura stramonium TaxID=4076 RepID=A0ABS8S1I8_DATST|nr:hypothetical protein [Datura stramonium]
MLKRERVKKGQNFGFGGILTRFLRGHDIKEEKVDYRPAYDLRGIDMTKTKESKGINGPVLSVNERNARINSMLSYLYGEPLDDDDVATEDEMARINSDLESSDDNEEDSEMGKAALAPTDDEE